MKTLNFIHVDTQLVLMFANMYGYWLQTKPIFIRIAHQDLHLVSQTLLRSNLDHVDFK